MYNKKVLIDSLKKLGSAKAPTQKKDMIIDPMGQWAHPGENTRIPSNRITMKGVNYPVLGIANTGQKQMMQPGQEYNFPGADYVDEYPQMRSGGLPNKKNSKKYSRSLDATNRLFAEHPWFKKTKSRKNKIYDPNAKYYQDGGTSYSNLPATYLSALQNFVYPEVIDLPEETDSERYGYDAALGVIKQNPNDPIANMNNPWWREHELFHHLQNQAGAMSTYGLVGQRPNPYVASDEAIGSYYDRRGAEFDIELNKIFEQNPNISEEEAFALAEENLYRNPKSVEGEARDYEGYIETGNSSIFPKRKKGGAIPKAQKGLSHTQLMQAYDDSLALYNSYNQFMNVLKNPQYKLPSTAISRYQGRNQGFGPWALPGNLYQNISPVKVFTYYQGNQPWRVFKYKKPVKPKSTVNPNQANNFITKSKPCVPKTTVINNVPEKAPFGKKLVGTNSETVPVTGKKCEYVQTINPIYEDLITEPIKIGTFPLKVEHGKLPELQPGNYFSEPLPEAPQYALEPYTDERLRLSIEPGKTKSKKHHGRLFGHGQKYSWHTYKPSKDLELRRKEVVRPIPALVQKLTGYDPKYFEGYEDEEGNFIPGELDYGNETGGKMEFRGAASLRDYMNQQKYAKEYEEYQKKLDEWDERYEQSKKKQAEGIAFKYGGLSKFLDGGPQCPEGYTYNPETKRCTRKNTNCPEGYFFDAQEGRCKSKAYREKFELYNKGTKITPTEEEESYSYWPDDLTLKDLDKGIMISPEGFENDRPFLINPIKTIGIYNPEKYEEDIDDRYLADAYVNVYPDLNYQVVVDPSKPKGYNADKSIYYVPDENNFEFEKFKQYKKLKEIEKENLSNLAKYPNLITKEWEEDNKYRPQDDPKQFLDAEYYGQGLPGYYTNLTDVPFDKYKNSIKRKFNTGCKDCKYHYGTSHEYNDDYNINLTNLGHVKKDFKSKDPSYYIRNIKEHDYVDLPDESMIPRFDLESADTPIYREGNPSMLVPHMRLEPGKTKSKKNRGRLIHGKGQKYKHTTYRQTKDLEFGTHKTNRPIPALVQKFTGYDPKYYQGYDKEVGDETEFVPGEIERAEQEGRKVNFKGAATLRDLIKQKKYERQWLEYQKQKDEVRQRNEAYLQEYNITPEEYEQYYGPFKRGGALPKAQDGIPQEFYQNWYQNRIMSTPEGQKLLDKIRPEALERSRQMIPYIYSDKLEPDDAGYYDTKTQQIILNKFLPEAQIEATKQHEFGHHIQAGNKFYNVLDKPHQFLVEQNIIEPEKISTGNSEWDEKLKENYDYVTQPDEMHARIMTLRRLAGFQPNQVITEKDLKDYFNRVKEAGEALDPDIEDLRGVTKGNQSIVNLLNDMVSVPSNREDLNIAQFGGSKENCPLGFIWNGIECIPNPFETRPSQRAAVYMDENGTYKMDPVYQQYSQQKFNVAQSNKKAQDFNKMYAQSKNYKRLLKKQGYTPKEIEDRINSVMNVNDFRYIDQGQSWVGTDENTGKEFISYNVTDPGDWPGFDQIAAHEWGHVGVDSGANPLKKKEREEFINRINKEQAGVTGNPDDLVHDMEPQENRADLLQLRQQLQEAGVFDSTKRKRFTKKDLDKYRKLMESSERNWDNMWNRMFRLYDDDSIIYFMNNVAKNDSDDNLQVAKQGLELDLSEDEIKKYVDGGYIVEDISVPTLTKMKKGGLPCPPFCSPLIELSKGLSSIAQNVPKTNFLGRGIANTATILDEGLGQAFLAKSNADAISAGNKWLHNWIQHPTTQMKIQADILDVINNKNLNPYRIKYETPRYGDIVLNPEEQYTEALKIAQNYMPDAKPYSFENFFSNLKEDKLNPMFDLMGVTYKHQSDPIMRSLYSHAFFKPNSTQIDTDYKPFKHYGTFVRRSPSFSPYQKELVTIHEGTHEWITDKLLKETGQKDLILSSIDPEIKKLWDKWSVDRETKDLTKDEKKLAYLANPTEVLSRVMELRRHNNLTPSDYVDEDMAKHYLKQIENGEITGGKNFATVLKNDPKTLSKLMNDLYNIAIPLGVGIGGAALLKNPYKEESPIGGYKMGGEFELGDEVDETTMKELKKLGFTFEKI